MKFGTNIYKFTQYGEDLAGTVEFVKTAEALGFNHVRFLDHVVGIIAERHSGIMQTPYTSKSYIHEVFTLMAFLAGQTSRICFMTGVLILPQRPTLLVAKQAAEVDILSGGRLTLGVGVGYNAIEFRAMTGNSGGNFAERGTLFEEQIEVLRRLWTKEDVTFKGRFHDIQDACLAPLPVQRPIPIWLGFGRRISPIPPDKVLRRVGRLADGCLPQWLPGEEARIALGKIHAAAREAGRNPDDITVEMSIYGDGRSKAELIDDIKRVRDFGAHQVHIRWDDLSSIRDNIEGIRRFREVMDAF
ncbi:MAG: LLM class F420-dependent oxidoreductase [Betaproteobacteria bacterium]|nr:LLM class F420-dependent oxidoreductase [Betaproteobacteria bacterium]